MLIWILMVITAVPQLINMRLAEMTHDQRMAHIKNIEIDIRKEEANIIKIIKNNYQKYTTQNKELCFAIIKELQK